MIECQADTIITRSNDLLATEVDGEIVLMNLERGNYYGLVGTARHIWDLLEEPRRLGDLCVLLGEKYSGSHAVIEADVTKFVTNMAMETIVTLS